MNQRLINQKIVWQIIYKIYWNQSKFNQNNLIVDLIFFLSREILLQALSFWALRFLFGVGAYNTRRLRSFFLSSGSCLDRGVVRIEALDVPWCTEEAGGGVIGDIAERSDGGCDGGEGASNDEVSCGWHHSLGSLNKLLLCGAQPVLPPNLLYVNERSC